LVIGDIHLQATGERFPVEELSLTDHDVVVSLSDVIDENRDHAKSAEAGDIYEQRGREFFKHLDEQGVPILAVPGNHDPIMCTQRLVNDLENIEIIHQDAVTISTNITDRDLTIVG
jgi:Icc-related predicted phosphoesterase